MPRPVKYLRPGGKKKRELSHESGQASETGGVEGAGTASTTSKPNCNPNKSTENWRDAIKTIGDLPQDRLAAYAAFYKVYDCFDAIWSDLHWHISLWLAKRNGVPSLPR